MDNTQFPTVYESTIFPHSLHWYPMNNTATTTVVNLRTHNYDQYIGRAGNGHNGYFGNPFPLHADTPAQREIVLEHYKHYFDKRIANDPEFRQRIHELKGKVLGCFCKPKQCHGDIIAEYLNSLD